MILPIETRMPNHRETPPQPNEPVSALSPMCISSVAGTPEVVAPIGEIPFKPAVTDHEEPLPIGVAVAGAPRTDIALLEIVRKAMERGSLSTRLRTGRSIYGSLVQQPFLGSSIYQCSSKYIMKRMKRFEIIES